ncbi:MAG: T9SS type A sorting domain-containing protein [Chitinophagaceae bacterium]
MWIINKIKATLLLRVLPFLLLVSFAKHVQAQASDYFCYIKNIAQLSSDTLQFEIWIESTGTDTLRLGAIQCGIDFNYAGMLNGGVISGMKKTDGGDPAVPINQQNPTIQLNNTSHQYRAAAQVAFYSGAAIIPPPPGFRIFTGWITNTVPFTPNSTPDFSWWFTASSTQTRTAVVGYKNSNTISQDLTIAPHHLVLGNPVLNQTPGIVSSLFSNNNNSSLDTICKGDPLSMKVQINGGTPPYEIKYSDGTAIYTVANYQSGDPIIILPSNTATYNLVSVKDFFGLTSPINTGSFTVLVNNSDKLVLAGINNSSSISGYVQISEVLQDDDLFLFKDNACNRLLQIDDHSGNNVPGLVKSSVTVDNVSNTFDGQPYCKRWFEIVASDNNNVDATVTLFATQQDFTTYNINNGDFRDLPTSGNNSDTLINNIRILEVNMVDSARRFLIPNVNWNQQTKNWELTFEANNYRRYYITSLNPDSSLIPSQGILFSGKKLYSSDELTWITYQEKSMGYFNLYHSTDSINYQLIFSRPTAAPNGNSNYSIVYKGYNNQPQLGHNYYRLELINKYGYSFFHPTVVDLVWGDGTNPITIYPNVIGGYNIDLFSTNDNEITIKVVDMSGRTIRKKKITPHVGPNLLTMDMQGVANGIYHFQIISGTQQLLNQKILKSF